MGKGIRVIKAVGIANRLHRCIEARIADAAAILVHRLTCLPATDAGSRRAASVLAPAWQHDLGGGVKKGIGGNCLHRGRLQRS